jgi:WD40 repeat protein
VKGLSASIVSMAMKGSTTGANNWIGIIIIVAILVGAFFFVSNRNHVRVPDAEDPQSITISTMPLFQGGLAAVGISADRIGFHSFSPDGKYFFFSAFKDGNTPANTAYLMKLGDGTIKPLPGMAERGLEDNRVIQLFGMNGDLILYFTQSDETKTYAIGDNIGFGSLSPDGKTYVVNTQSGIKKIDIGSGLVTSFTKSRYDGAYAWYPDSVRVLGYKESGENLFEAGKGRTLGVWNMDTGDFLPLSTSISEKSIRMAQWVVPGVVARVNTGWDDGSHDYLVNVDTKRVVDIGDTSGSLMGGVQVDSARGLFAVVGGDDQSAIGSKVLVYRAMEQTHELILPPGYFRSTMHIVDGNRLLYLRTKWENNKLVVQEVVLLDLKAETETVVRQLPPRDYASLSISADHKTWVLTRENEFITGTL